MDKTVTFQWQMWDATHNEGHMMTTSISKF